ncbi:MAG: DNA repair protein RecN, partial [Rhodobiaceae bacterium]|nr:DNA repair protein RecN [Rhodobiaceae bacterium]
LRALARKHDIPVDALAEKAEGFRTALQSIETGSGDLAALEKAAADALGRFNDRAARLSARREKAALALDKAINGELAPLKLEAARFTTRVEQDVAPGSHGIDSVSFEVQTNPGSRAGPLLKVASGGELSRILLALKVSLAERGSAPTLVFDEIDTAVGGAVSDAIGQRLRRLAEKVQVISITHAPQVAARASHHFRIAKTHRKAENLTSTDVAVLDADARQEEIARMLAGATVTDEARAAAARLMAHAG